MAKYKVGDKVRIVKQRPDSYLFVDEMVKYLDKTLTVRGVYGHPESATYLLQEAYKEYHDQKYYWVFLEDWIAGFAEPKKPDFPFPSTSATA